jgi:HK97 family phage major capsid protein/HK97 family phage prohead protease
MSEGNLNNHGGIVRELSAAEEATLDERGIPTKLGRQYRRVQVASDGYNADDHTVSMAVSSETPVDRYYGDEILSHAKGAIRTNRLKGGVSLLFNHNYDALLGRTTDYKLTDGGPLTVTARFGPSSLAQEKEAEVAAGVLVDVSIGYIVHEWEIVEDKNGNRTYTATDWELLEASLVTVPADPTVGVGRAADAADHPVKVRSFTRATDEPAETKPVVEPAATEGDRALAAGGNAGENTNVTEVGVPKAARAVDPVSETETSTKTPTEQRTTTMAEATTTTTTTVDLAAQNQARLTGLRALHTQYPNEFNERALKAAESLDVSVDAVKGRIADSIIAGSQRSEVPTLGDEIADDMNERETKQYSLRNAYAYAVNQVKPGTFRDKGAEAGLEREISQTLSKRAEQRGVPGLGGSLLIPGATSRLFARQAQQRALASGGGAGTATNVIEVTPEPIELLRARTAVLALGARMMTGLFGEIKLPRQTGAGTSNWLAEGSAATETDPTLDAITMSPSRLSMWNAYYRELLLQSALSVDAFLAADRMNVLARSLDTACIAGSGTAPVPLGLLNQSGLTAVLAGTTRAANGTVTAGSGGVAPTFVDYNNMEAAIATANADIGTMSWLSTPKIRAAGRSIPQIPGSAVSGFTWPNSKVDSRGIQEGPLGYPALVTSNAVLTGFTANSVANLHAIVLGVWDQMLIGDWGLSEVIVDPYTGASEALYNITEHAFYGTNVRHIAAFCACTSALPS